jgi:hypothetical protein
MQPNLVNICQDLGYTHPERMRGMGRGAGLTYHCNSQENIDVIIRFFPCKTPEEAPSALCASLTRQWNTTQLSTSTWVTGAQSGSTTPVEQEPDLRELLLEAKIKWELAESSPDSGISPILEFGHYNRYMFEVRPYYTRTLLDLTEKMTPASPEILFALIDKIWRALEYLHHQDINQPHGNLTLANVGLHTGTLVETSVALFDIRNTPETQRRKEMRRDYENLGLILYHLVSSFNGHIDSVEARIRCGSTNWKNQLGRTETLWKELCQALLDKERYPEWTTFRGRREEWLQPLAPAKTNVLAAAPVKTINALPPMRDSIIIDTCHEPVANSIDTEHAYQRYLNAGDPTSAFNTVLSSTEPIEKKIDWCNIISENLSGTLSFMDSSQVRLLLEEAARLGSPMAALRLGESLVQDYPGEALPWLDLAAEAGLPQAVPLLAHLHEWGGDGVPRDPQKAALLYQLAIEHNTDSDFLYRLASLIIREREDSLRDRLPDVVKLLQQADDMGDFRATDLLGQCFAHGIGSEMDEKRAFHLFTKSWDISKKTNNHYFTASNNIGVCLVIGFGCSRDDAMAQHYFKQGAISGHEASNKNLQKLIQSSYSNR